MQHFLVLCVGAMLWVSPSLADDRQVLELTTEQRGRLVTQMNGFLEAIQDIVLGIAEDDMEAVREAADACGMRHGHEPGQRGTGVGRVAPPEFRQMGRGMHLAFDELAQASEFGPQVVLEELGVLMSNCMGCHASFRVMDKP